MGWYDTLHSKGEEFIERMLKKRGHNVLREKRMNHEVIFDVYDETTQTAYEILTAKIVRSSHEQDEAIIAKIFRYLLWCKQLRFVLVSYDHKEIEMFHRLGLQHWHLKTSSWYEPRFEKMTYHRGKSALAIARSIYKAMTRFAPLKEWVDEKRAQRHRKEPVPKRFEQITKRLGLPKNFLRGLWRDWRLQWVWKLERILPLWKKRKQR